MLRNLTIYMAYADYPHTLCRTAVQFFYLGACGAQAKNDNMVRLRLKAITRVQVVYESTQQMIGKLDRVAAGAADGVVVIGM